MCDYSLENIASRPAKVGDKLTSTRFDGRVTRGFASVDDPHTAVCLMPGTEVAFTEPVRRESGLFSRSRLDSQVARFRSVNEGQPYAHHDALEFSNGEVVLVTDLIEGQRAVVLQLPASAAGKDEKASVPSEEAAPALPAQVAS